MGLLPFVPGSSLRHSQDHHTNVFTLAFERRYYKHPGVNI